MKQVDEIISAFLLESRDMIDEVIPQIISWFNNDTGEVNVDIETTNRIFRMFHSIKGTAGCLQFNYIVKVTHEAETFLDLIRNNKTQVIAKDTDLLCRTCDIINILIDQIERTGSDKGIESKIDVIISELTNRIANKYQADKSTDVSLSLNIEVIQRFVSESDELIEQVESSLIRIKNHPHNIQEEIEIAYRSLHSFKGNCGFLGYGDLEKLSHKMETIFDSIKENIILPDEDTLLSLLYIIDILRQTVINISNGSNGKIDNIVVLIQMLKDFMPTSKESPSNLRPLIEQQEAITLLREKPFDNKSIKNETDDSYNNDNAKSLKPRSVNRQDIRVDLNKLDQLINLVGELVIAESMVVRNPDLNGYEFENFERSATHLNKIVRELQDIALSVRMVPIAGIFKRMIRLVHDLSIKANKKINLKIVGEDTEIDKTVVELMADPLVHLIRNSIDHGIESSEERANMGKNSIGEILIEAKHEGGEVWIIIKDDGRGLDRDKIFKKGLERGLIRDNGDNLTENEIYNLIFMPGFSTAEKITDISGRGVGMDVVKKNIEKIKGTIEIHTKKDKYSMFILRIPLTLAIMEGMLVRVGKICYTIPLLSIRESVQIVSEQITTTMDGQELVNIRDELLLVLRLHKIHNIKPDHESLTEGLLVVVEYQNETICLLVDEILGDQQAVIKGLSKYIGDIAGVSGCTILGNGEISLILDIGGLIRQSQKN